jgi:hypothetical protein
LDEKDLEEIRQFEVIVKAEEEVQRMKSENRENEEQYIYTPKSGF